jgi:hypothetical protein
MSDDMRPMSEFDPSKPALRSTKPTSESGLEIGQQRARFVEFWP